MTPCPSIHPQTGRPCEKPAGHHLLTDGRYLHRATERHAGPLAKVYPASWIHVWGFRSGTGLAR